MKTLVTIIIVSFILTSAYLNLITWELAKDIGGGFKYKFGLLCGWIEKEVKFNFRYDCEKIKKDGIRSVSPIHKELEFHSCENTQDESTLSWKNNSTHSIELKNITFPPIPIVMQSVDN